MKAKNGYNSACRAFPKERIWHNDTKHVPKGSVHPKGPQDSWNNKFWGVERGPRTWFWLHSTKSFMIKTKGRLPRLVYPPKITQTKQIYNIIWNQLIHKKWILRRWYTHSSISYAHGGNETPWRWPYGRNSKIPSRRICILGVDMKPKSGHFSGCRAFRKVITWHNAITHISVCSVHPKGLQNN